MSEDVESGCMLTSMSTLSSSSPACSISWETEGVDGWVMLTSGGSPNSRVMVVVMVVVVVEVVPGDVSRRRLTAATPSSDTILKEHWNISMDCMYDYNAFLVAS